MIIFNLKAIEKMLLKITGENLDPLIEKELVHVIKILHDAIKCMEQFKRDFRRWL
jgi:hypothetical protein